MANVIAASTTTNPLWEYISRAERDKIPLEDYAWPDAPDRPEYPCDTQAHLDSCARLLGHAPASEQDKIKARAIHIAKRHKLQLPDTWAQGGTPANESLTEASFSPKPRIAQLKVLFLRDGAISLNGRQYPPSAVAALVRSAQETLVKLDGPIINSCISHEAADNAENNPLLVSGKATQVWQEGHDAYALLDIPDTTTGRDIVALLKGGYIPPTMSLRASGAVMKLERGNALPQVGGDLKLEGIDFAPRPGLDFARIQDMTLESAAACPQTITDYFSATQVALLLEQEAQEEEGSDTMSKTEKSAPTIEKVTPASPNATNEASPQPTTPQTPIAEAANTILSPLTSGDSQSVDGTPGSQYANRVFPKVGGTIPPDDFFKGSGGVSAQESRETHDHMAVMLGMPCAPGGGATESASNRFFNKTMESHAVSVHDLHAHKLGLGCEGSYQQMAPLQSDPAPDDGPDDDAMESTRRSGSLTVSPPVVTTNKEENVSMRTEEALALLREQGYTGMTPPKTAEEKLREDLEAKFEAKLAAQRQEFEESQKQMLAKIAPAQHPRAQRSTLVESTHTARESEPLPGSPRARRTRIQEALMEADWQQLADPSQPLPEGVTWQDVLKHFGRLMVTDYQVRYGSQTIRPRNA